MRKYMPVLIMIVLIFSFVTVVSAADANDTQDMSDSTTISQVDSVTTDESIASTKKIEKTETKITEKESEMNNEGDDCCSAIIQGYNNDSTISFRRDSTASVTINVTHNTTYIKQNKGSGSYFCHVLISSTGWLVGSGGTDAPETSRGIESNARSIIENNNLNNASFNKIINLKKNSAKGHVVIKAPNGTYALFIIYYGKTYKETGVLQPGQFLSVPNNPANFVKGQYQTYTKSSYFIQSSKLIAAMDKYGVERRNIITYYYKRTNLTSTVKVYASNDDGRYVNKKTAKYVDSIRTNTKFISYKNIPTVEGWINVDTVNFNIKAKTTVISPTVTTKTEKVSLKANVKDEFGNPVNGGRVSLVVNNKTYTHSNGSVVYSYVKNGVASITYKIPNIWKAKSYSYYFKYIGTSKYYSKTGTSATLKIGDLTTMTVTHANSTQYSTNLTIIAKVTYTSNKTKVTGGSLIFKINGKTIKNSDGTTHYSSVKNGVGKYNIKLSETYSPKTYNITVVYSNGVQRVEKVSKVTINKIATKVLSPKVKVSKNVVTVTGSLVDKTTNVKIKYKTYVSVKINGITIKNTDGTTRKFNVTKGVINFNFTLPNTYKKGNHTLTIVVPELKETLSVRQNAVMKIV